ncbi:MAG TPA: CRISPR-associated protein Cas4 [Anaerolineae bacterium]|nr:CRISPR-associated protein Cas4 [Anaerolineae bacterium]
MSTDSADLIPLTVTDIKNFVYCPRVVYHMHFLTQRPVTYKMEEGKLQHARAAELEGRRSLRAYGLADGQRHFGVRLRSERLGLSGWLDMAIVREGEAIPVEFKHSTRRLGLNHKYQLTAYGLLLEERYGRPVRRGFAYFIPAKRAQEVIITPNMRRYVTRLLGEIREMLATEALPRATAHRERCADCEFRNFCGDV